MFHFGGKGHLSSAAFLVAGLTLIPATASVAGGWYIAPDYTYTSPDHDVFNGGESSLGLSLGKRFLSGNDAEVSFSKQKFVLYNEPAYFHRTDFSAGGRWTPDADEMSNFYISAGLGLARLEYPDKSFLGPTAFAGLGYRIQFPGLKNLDFLAEARIRYTRNDENNAKSDLVDTQAVVKVRLSTPMSPSTSGQAQPSPSEARSYDAPDRPEGQRQMCATLLPGSLSYANNRCYVFEDEDKDGVPDMNDLCKNTVPGVAVDRDGCMTSERQSAP